MAPPNRVPGSTDSAEVTSPNSLSSMSAAPSRETSRAWLHPAQSRRSNDPLKPSGSSLPLPRSSARPIIAVPAPIRRSSPASPGGAATRAPRVEARKGPTARCLASSMNSMTSSSIDWPAPAELFAETECQSKPSSAPSRQYFGIDQRRIVPAFADLVDGRPRADEVSGGSDQFELIVRGEQIHGVLLSFSAGVRGPGRRRCFAGSRRCRRRWTGRTRRGNCRPNRSCPIGRCCAGCSSR